MIGCTIGWTWSGWDWRRSCRWCRVRGRWGVSSDGRGGKRLPEGGRTLPIGTKVDVTDRTPRITPPRGTPDTLDGRTTAPFATQKPLDQTMQDDGPTRAGD